MIYVAIASGSWKMAYAAKLQDGLPGLGGALERSGGPGWHSAASRASECGRARISLRRRRIVWRAISSAA